MYNLYSNACDDRWRYVLGKAGHKPLLVIGLNPSTATQEKSDTTVAKVETVARMNGYDGFTMLNLYPVRATDYNTLPVEVEKAAFDKNIQVIIRMVSKTLSPPAIWAAWGESIMARPYFSAAVLELATVLKQYDVSWLHLGELTRTGHPRHPSRLHYGWRFSVLDMDRYAKVLELNVPYLAE